MAGIAALFIVVGAAGLLPDLWPLLTPGAAQQLARLRADGWTELAPAWALRILAIAGGIGLLKQWAWARWALLAWMVVHVWVAALHSWEATVLHTVLFAGITWVLFGRVTRAR